MMALMWNLQSLQAALVEILELVKRWRCVKIRVMTVRVGELPSP